MNNLVVVGGIAGAGKDTFFKISSEIGVPDIHRFAFADKLKEEIRPILLEKYEIDILDCTREDKEKIRQELIDYGMNKRHETEGRYWVEKLAESLPEEGVGVVTDWRFPNEYILLEEMGYNVIGVHLQCWSRNGIECPTIPEEIENDPLIRNLADFRIFWPRVDDLKLLNSYVLAFWNKLKNP